VLCFNINLFFPKKKMKLAWFVAVAPRLIIAHCFLHPARLPTRSTSLAPPSDIAISSSARGLHISSSTEFHPTMRTENIDHYEFFQIVHKMKVVQELSCANFLSLSQNLAIDSKSGPIWTPITSDIVSQRCQAMQHS
jgi:hypothetical protein